MPLETTFLTDVEEAYLADHRSRNSSPNTIEHYVNTFKDLHRFLDATGRDATLEGLSTTTLQAFHTWLVETPILRRWRGTTARSSRSIQSRMKDLRALLAWATEHEYLAKAPRIAILRIPQTLFPIFTDAELVTLFSCPHLTAKESRASAIAPWLQCSSTQASASPSWSPSSPPTCSWRTD